MVPSSESTAEATDEVVGLNFSRRSAYAADGRDGTSPRSQLGFARTCLSVREQFGGETRQTNEPMDGNQRGSRRLPPD